MQLQRLVIAGCYYAGETDDGTKHCHGRGAQRRGTEGHYRALSTPGYPFSQFQHFAKIIVITFSHKTLLSVL